MSTGRLGAGDTAIQPTIFDAKGDLIVATAADTPARLAVGSANQVLTVDSSTATGLKWAAPAGGGKVLQVVTATTTTETSTTSQSFVDVTNLTASITPSAASSKVLVLVNMGVSVERNGDQGHATFKLVRAATDIYQPERFGYFQTSLGVTFITEALQSMIYLDSPNTTSATAYKVQVASDYNVVTVKVNDTNKTSTITLMEIGA
jgi:hypothetical protein